MSRNVNNSLGTETIKEELNKLVFKERYKEAL